MRSDTPPVPAAPIAELSVTAVVLIVSVSLAPTWNEKRRAVNTAVPLNLVSSVMSPISLAIWKTSAAIASWSSELQRAVVELDLQVTHALQHRVHLGQRTFRGLDERDAVLRVALRLSQATDLTAHLLADREAGGVVGRTVDAVAAGELLHRLRRRVRRRWSAAGAC